MNQNNETSGETYMISGFSFLFVCGMDPAHNPFTEEHWGEEGKEKKRERKGGCMECFFAMTLLCFQGSLFLIVATFR